MAHGLWLEDVLPSTSRTGGAAATLHQSDTTMAMACCTRTQFLVNLYTEIIHSFLLVRCLPLAIPREIATRAQTLCEEGQQENTCWSTSDGQQNNASECRWCEKETSTEADEEEIDDDQDTDNESLFQLHFVSLSQPEHTTSSTSFPCR
mmetsp:Transcript_21646/g.53030  ORF Transcript_21646/g.53030 Transcript_21646/m.53030 type:complete len:149 (-) Transcript_21646:78-524(-)